MTNLAHEALGRQITRFRKEDGRSVDLLCQLARVSRATWYRVEAGNARIENIRRVIAVFGMKLSLTKTNKRRRRKHGQ